jgi:hypothetical protein
MTATLADYTGDVAALTYLAQQDIDALFQQIVNPDAEKVRDALGEILPGLVETYGSASATLAANWYDDRRDAANLRGRLFRAIPAVLPGLDRTDALAGWAVAPLFQEKPDTATTVVKLAGGLQRISANAGRDTITGSTAEDPKALGWKRVGVGGSCGFCRMLLSRGAVYKSDTVHFEAHDHCNCGAAPEFRAR